MRIKLSFYAFIATILISTTPTTGQSQGYFPGTDILSVLAPMPALSVGYMFPAGPTTLKKDIKSTDNNHFRKLTQSYNLEGPWIEFAVPFRPPYPIGFEIGGAYLLSSNSRSEETYTTNNSNGVGTRSWRTSTQLWNAQMLATYQITSSISGLLGFRYYSLVTKFSEPQGIGAYNSWLAHWSNLDVLLDIPYIGITYARSFINGPTINAGMIGLPFLSGDVSYRGRGPTLQSDVFEMSKEIHSGYFVEAWAGLSFPVTPWLRAAAFSKYSGVSGKTLGTTSWTYYDSDSKKVVNDLETDAAFDTGAWIVGGSITASF